ncbi:MAG: response regulator [Acidobacteriota bacterium]|nr:response regulator [Acidobacteriota bacterium]
MKQSKHSILCVDDDKDNLDLIKFVFEEKDFEVIACDSLEDCLLQIRRNRFNAIILDNHFNDRTSLEICREIRLYNPYTPIIFFSGEARPAEIENALKAGGNAYLVKPNDFHKLTETVAAHIRQAQSEV